MEAQLESHNVESATRVSTFYQALSVGEQNYFLQLNGLQRIPQPAIQEKDMSPHHHSRIRANEALRLVRDENKMLEDYKGQKLLVATTLPRTEEDVKSWFTTLDSTGCGSISKDDVRDVFTSLQDYGTPNPMKLIDALLSKMRTVEGRLTLDEFTLCVMSFVKQ